MAKRSLRRTGCVALDRSGASVADAVDRSRFAQISAGQSIIEGWFQRAVARLGAPDNECFEPFIFGWIAFNAWGESVTGAESDRDWVRALARDEELSRGFAYLVQDPMGDIARSAQRFRGYWPIPKVQDWRRLQPTGRPTADTNDERLDFFEEHGISYEPTCARRHGQAAAIPLDWEHFLHATYRVRCNLFHGAKSLGDLHDQAIVASSFRTLVGFLARQEIFGR